MEITGIISALFIGGIIGMLGRVVVPGKQRISAVMTVLVGMAAALIGTFAATVIGVANTDGIDWIELALQIGLAGVGVTALANRKAHQYQ